VAVFAYSPAVWVYIKSLATGITYDVSEDMVRGQTVLRSNAPHQMTITLMNKNRRYDALFAPCDLFTIYMKRIRRMQIMSGYLDSVPWYSTWERSVQLFGTCTIKRLLQKRWDPGTIAALTLMASSNATSQQFTSDGGMQAKANAVITQVGGWPEDTIHIASLPDAWAVKIQQLYSAASPMLMTNVLTNTGGAVSSSANNSPMVGSTMLPQNLPPTISPAESAYFSLSEPTQGLAAVPYSPKGPPFDIVQNPGGQAAKYYCQMNWNYLAPGGSFLRKQIRAWLAAPSSKGSGPVMVYSQVTGKTVLCTPVGQGPGKYSATNPKIGLSPDAMSALAITDSMIQNGTNLVYVAWCDQTVQANIYPPGPWPVVEKFTKNKQGKLVPNITKAPVTPTSSNSVSSNNSDPFPPGTQQSTTQGQTVVNFCENLVGKANYVEVAGSNTGQPSDGKYGNGVPGYDCSGLAYEAWLNAGLQWPHESTYGYWDDSNVAKFYDTSNLVLGDLIFFNEANTAQDGPDHMAIYTGVRTVSGTQLQYTVQASDPQQGIHDVALAYSGHIHGFGRPTGYPGFQTTSAGTAAGSGSAGSSGSSSSSSSGSGSSNNSSPGFASGAGITQSQVNTSFVNYWEWYGQGPTAEGSMLNGIRGLLNDQPLLPFINTVLNCGMRSWCSAPNGDFIAWFPDYFGAYGMAATIKIEDVELMDFSMSWSDQNLVTHQYVASSWVGSIFGNSPAGSVGVLNMATTDGVVTLEMGSLSNNILQTVLNLSQNDKSNLGNPQAILNRFGARPNFQEIGTIMGQQAQWFYALFLFTLNWASMWTVNVPTTFMPEAFPGMLMRLDDGFQAYINQVVHAWDFTDGGPGFTTQMAVMAPSDYKGGGLFGLPNGGQSAVV
jgi:hypothetical protein